MILSAINELNYYRLGFTIKTFVRISFTIVPIIILIKCIIDLFKIIINPDESKNTPKTIARRFISGLIIFLLPVITDYSFKTLTDYNDKLIVKYYEGATTKKIKEYEKLAEHERQEELNKKIAKMKETAIAQAEARAKLNAANSDKMSSYKKNRNKNSGSDSSSEDASNPVSENDNGYVPESSSEDFQVDAAEAQAILDRIPKEGVSGAQVAIFANGKITSGASYNSDNGTKYDISSASKMILGITAAQMADDGLINLDKNIATYWNALGSKNFNSCTDEWRSYIGSAQTLRNYSQKRLVENPATLRNCLTHSSTIKNMSMVYMVPNDHSSEYFGGGMSKTYARSIFMLAHTSHQLFNQGATPGTSTAYNYASDTLTREHALAGFTMQIAMNESVNEYLSKRILSPLGASGGFKTGNSIYFATSYSSSAIDLAKIIAAIANDGQYEGQTIFTPGAISEIERVNPNLKNQTIAFDYINGKFVKYGYFSSISNASGYGVSETISDYATYITYDPKTSIGMVVNIKYDKSSYKKSSFKTFDDLSNYFYTNS